MERNIQEDFLKEFYYEKIRFLERELKKYKQTSRSPEKTIATQELMEIKKDYKEIIQHDKILRQSALEQIPEIVEKFDKLKINFENILKNI